MDKELLKKVRTRAGILRWSNKSKEEIQKHISMLNKKRAEKQAEDKILLASIKKRLKVPKYKPRKRK